MVHEGKTIKENGNSYNCGKSSFAFPLRYLSGPWRFHARSCRAFQGARKIRIFSTSKFSFFLFGLTMVTPRCFNESSQRVSQGAPTPCFRGTRNAFWGPNNEFLGVPRRVTGDRCDGFTGPCSASPVVPVTRSGKRSYRLRVVSATKGVHGADQRS